MQCPRLDHFVRLNHTGKIGKCGHMTKAKEFDSIEQLHDSDWLRGVKAQMEKGQWPKECVRCEMTEKTSNTSIRLDMIERDRILKAVKKDYLIVGGVLDNICNSACQSCDEDLSTKIGSLKGKDYKRINNYENFWQLPLERIVELDINGGEPTASPNYKKLLRNLPESVKIVRINTNVSRMIPEVEMLLQKGIRVIITLSFDGTGIVHDYVRWPIKWTAYQSNVASYIELGKKYDKLRLNCWTTVSCLNVGDFDNIVAFTKENNLDHAYGFCIRPVPLDVRYSNPLTVQAKDALKSSQHELSRLIADKCATNKDNTEELQQFIQQQDSIRNISYKDYYKDLF